MTWKTRGAIVEGLLRILLMRACNSFWRKNQTDSDDGRKKQTESDGQNEPVTIRCMTVGVGVLSQFQRHFLKTVGQLARSVDGRTYERLWEVGQGMADTSRIGL